MQELGAVLPRSDEDSSASGKTRSSVYRMPSLCEGHWKPLNGAHEPATFEAIHDAQNSFPCSPSVLKAFPCRSRLTTRPLRE